MVMIVAIVAIAAMFIVSWVIQHNEQMREYDLLEKGITPAQIRGTWPSAAKLAKLGDFK